MDKFKHPALHHDTTGYSKSDVSTYIQKVVMALGRERWILRVATAAAAAFSISCFAARRAALRFVRGAMDGAKETLLGRGLGRAAPPLLSAVARTGLGGRTDGRAAAGRTETLDGRGRVDDAGRTGAAEDVEPDAADAGRARVRDGVSALVELLRDSFGAVGARN